MTPEPNAPLRIPSLDGIRAVAVLIVLVAHCRLEGIVPGGFGVTIFFVLSGYLITTLLMREFARDRDISLKGFYWRRALRILPPVFITLIVATVLHTAAGFAPAVRWEALALLAAFCGNYFVALTPDSGIPQGTAILWSLAVEEHFYLLYPALALALFGRGSTRFTSLVLVALCLIILIWRSMAWGVIGLSESYIYAASDTRMDALVYGCLLAVALNPIHHVLALRWRWPSLIAAALVLLTTLLFREPWFAQTLRYSLQPLALLPFFYWAIATPDWGPFRLLSLPILVAVGQVSYGIYLLHYVLIYQIEHWLPGLPLPALLALATLGSYALARWMYRSVERPLQALR